MFYTGLDLHKSFSYITTMDDKDQNVTLCSFVACDKLLDCYLQTNIWIIVYL